MNFPYYPINDYGPLMKGLVIGSVAIVHVFLAQFAIGGGMLLCYFQHRAMKREDARARQFVDGYFRWLVLISFVLGALTGVAIWFTSIQVSPRTIGLMIDEFHWVWAIEWTFFCAEVGSGYAFYRYSHRLNDRTRFRLLVVYSLAAWFSLFWINGILSWQLTPGAWLETHRTWAGFFNPTFWPSLVFRTVAAMAEAGLFACVVINFSTVWDREAKTKLLHQAMRFLVPMALMPLIGVWFLGAAPEDSRIWVTGASPAMTMFMTIGVGASLLIGLYAAVVLFNRRMFLNGTTALMLTFLALCATAGGEFVREGMRKPYTVRNTLFSNSIRENEAAEMRRIGSVTHDPYPLLGSELWPNDQLRLGGKTFRFQCGVCHTVDGVNGVLHLTGSWTVEQLRLNVAQLQRTKTFMPPFCGTPEELEALVQWLQWIRAGKPHEWAESTDQAVLALVRKHLDEVGVRPGKIIETSDSPEAD